MRQLHCLIFGAALLGFLQLPGFSQEKQADPKDAPKVAACCPPGHSFKHLDGRPLVFVANGVGGSTTVSDNLLDLNGAKNLGLRIQMVPWCRHNSPLEDLTDHQAQLHAATRIACAVTAFRRDCPNLPIFFVGHSAGARIVLAAAEMLPEKSVDRIILLAPAVSCGYDLTGALRASRGGIDHFWSSLDGVLQTAEDYSALADGVKGPAAGRVGFRPAFSDKKDIEAFRNVRQYRWTEEFSGSGGHFAWTLRHNMKKVVAPLFFAPHVHRGAALRDPQDAAGEVPPVSPSVV